MTLTAERRSTIAPVSPAPPAPDPSLLRQLGRRYDGPRDLPDQLRLAAAFADAREGLPSMYRGSPGDVLVSIYRAMALDIPVTVAFEQLVIRGGRSGMTGALMQALIIRAGHKLKLIGDPTEQRVEMELVRCDDQPGGRAAWTIGEAAGAGLTRKDSWQLYPADMLYWRCTARVGRRYASDVLQGFGHLPEELANGSVGDLDDVSQDRPVDPDVMTFLADLDVLDYAATREKWRQARKLGLSDRHADTIEGHSVTVEQVIMAVMDRRRPAPTPAAADRVPVAPAAALGALLPCGCDPTQVIATGDHLSTCTDATNPLLPADTPTAAIPQPRACGCVLATVDTPHREGCQLAAFEVAWKPFGQWPPLDDES